MFLNNQDWKRLALVLLFLMTIISFTGCGNNIQITSTPTVEQVTDTTVPSSTFTATIAPTDTPTPTSTFTATLTSTPTKTMTPTSTFTASPTLTSTATMTPTPTFTATLIPTATTTATPTETYVEDFSDGLTSTQRNSINMLNYMTALAQRINVDKGNQMFLESAYSSLENDIFPNAVDRSTEAQITNLMDTIFNYRMINVKRSRLEYIYEQNRAQALRQAIPNPIGLLSMVDAKDPLKTVISILYMAVDSVTSYISASSQAEMQFIQDGWELDDAESAELHNSTKTALTYMFTMVRNYDLPGDYALSKENIESFISWSNKPDSQIISKISWLEAHQNTYKKFGSYWLELAKDYYTNGDYENCLDAVKQYESISTRIFRKDLDYANVLPMAIMSAKETMTEGEYVNFSNKYCPIIIANTKDSNWALRYFAAQIYLDLYTITEDSSYLNKAYKIAYDNVVNLVDQQKKMNADYLAEVQEVKPASDATKREKAEIKQYNKLLKTERKTALPPVSDALYLNCDLMFALAEKIGISEREKSNIEAILHENGSNIFLSQYLDDKFWFSEKNTPIDPEVIYAEFTGNQLILPASILTDRSTISIVITNGESSTKIDDWTISSVERAKNADVSDFRAKYLSKDAGSYKYKAGDKIIITVIPVTESPELKFDIIYNVIPSKDILVFDSISFERERK